MFKKTLGWLVVVGGISFLHLLLMPAAVAGITIPETHPIGPDSGSGGSGGYGNSGGYDNGAAIREQQRQEAERRAEAERQAELERQRKAEDERRRQEEAKRQAEFIRDRDATPLRGSTGIRITPNTSDGTALRGSTTDTGLRGLNSESNTPQLRGSGTEAGSQLKSAEKHSREGGVLRDELSSDEAKKGFDTAGEKSGSLVYPDKKSGGRSTFGSTLPPEAKKDPQIQQSLAWHRKNESLKADTAKKIAAIKEQQKKGAGDEAVLSAQMGTLTNQLNQYTKDEAKAKQDIKARVKDLGLSWDEK